MTTALPILRGPRIPETAGHGFKCEYLRGTLTGAECLRRQAKREVVRSTGASRVPQRLEYCASGKCEQGNEIRAKFPHWKPEERTRPDPSWATYVQPPRPDKLPPAIAEDIAEDLARAAQQAERDQAAAAVEEAQPVIAERAPKARRSWDEFRTRKEKQRAAAPAEEKKEPEPHPLSRRGLTESKEEEDVEEKNCATPGCKQRVRANSKSGQCRWCARGYGLMSPKHGVLPPSESGNAKSERQAPVRAAKRNGAPPRRKILGRRARAAQRAAPDAPPSGSAPDDVEEILQRRLTYYRVQADRCERALKALRR